MRKTENRKKKDKSCKTVKKSNKMITPSYKSMQRNEKKNSRTKK